MKKFFVLISLFIFSINTANAAVRISPAFVELDANKVKKDYVTGSFTVTGGKNETIRFKGYPVFFEYNSKGDFVEVEDKGQKNSLMDKIKFYPQEFTCKDGADQKVRFTITGLKSLPTGESKVVIFLEDANTKEIIVRNLKGGIGGRIIIKTRVGVPIYVEKGMYSKRGTLDSVSIKKSGEDYIVNYKVTATGNSQIRCNGFGCISQGDKLIQKFEAVGSVVEGGKSVEKTQKLNIPKEDLTLGQEYKVKFVLTYKDEHDREKILKREFSFIPEKAQKIETDKI